jgi:hypothetical protein
MVFLPFCRQNIFQNVVDNEKLSFLAENGLPMNRKLTTLIAFTFCRRWLSTSQVLKNGDFLLSKNVSNALQGAKMLLNENNEPFTTH